eukprot:scaffold3794_cov147-Skeletonema_menzelii.AAC.2
MARKNRRSRNQKIREGKVVLNEREVSASLERLSYVLYVTGLYVFERDRETVVINSWEVIRLLIKNTIAFKSCCIHIIGLPCVRLDSLVSEST